MSCDDITEYGDANKKTVNGEKQMKYKDKVHIIIHQNGLDLVVVDDEKHKRQYEMII